jgi:hypothetical protein
MQVFLEGLPCLGVSGLVRDVGVLFVSERKQKFKNKLKLKLTRVRLLNIQQCQRQKYWDFDMNKKIKSGLTDFQCYP